MSAFLQDMPSNLADTALWHDFCCCYGMLHSSFVLIMQGWFIYMVQSRGKCPFSREVSSKLAEMAIWHCGSDNHQPHLWQTFWFSICCRYFSCLLFCCMLLYRNDMHWGRTLRHCRCTKVEDGHWLR